jgi:peptidoglycan/LPS O-acetylase OafA/YrhL
MPSRISEAVFGEPSGRRHALVMFAGAAAFAAMYAYYGVVDDSASAGWLLFMTGGSALSGIAESLPTERRRAAGALRVAAVLLLACLLVLVAVAPEVVVGTR